jgi:hypothetical protein
MDVPGPFLKFSMNNCLFYFFKSSFTYDPKALMKLIVGVRWCSHMTQTIIYISDQNDHLGMKDSTKKMAPGLCFIPGIPPGSGKNNPTLALTWGHATLTPICIDPQTVCNNPWSWTSHQNSQPTYTTWNSPVSQIHTNFNNPRGHFPYMHFFFCLDSESCSLNVWFHFSMNLY